MDRLISLQAAIDAADKIIERDTSGSNAVVNAMIAWSEYIRTLPSAQPEIIRCKDCRHWVRTCGDNQWGLGDCDVFDKRLVMCEGYCAWAERRSDEAD